MKIGVISDIHNNVVALEAVLDKFAAENCDKIICAGDIIGIGPYPEETVQRIMEVPNLIAVRGNHEKYLTEVLPSQIPNSEFMEQEEIEHHKWEHSRLSKSSKNFLEKLPCSIDINIAGKNISVMHYFTNDKNQYIYTPNPTKKDLTNLFPSENQDIIIYGHDHTPNIVNTNGKWFINSGALGCPGNEKNIARAAILEIRDNGDTYVKGIKAEYDVLKVIEDIERLKYPDYEKIECFFYGTH